MIASATSMIDLDWNVIWIFTSNNISKNMSVDIHLWLQICLQLTHWISFCKCPIFHPLHFLLHNTLQNINIILNKITIINLGTTFDVFSYCMLWSHSTNYITQNNKNKPVYFIFYLNQFHITNIVWYCLKHVIYWWFVVFFYFFQQHFTQCWQLFH